MSTRIPRLTRAGDLLLRLETTGALSIDAVAQRIGVSESIVRLCVEGRAPLPVDAQLLLATVTLERAPTLSRKAHALRGQAETAKRFAAGEVVGHMIARPPWAV
jgi:hypothetical protein